MNDSGPEVRAPAPATVAQVAAAGANVYVAGNAVFRDPRGYAPPIGELRAGGTAAYVG